MPEEELLYRGRFEYYDFDLKAVLKIFIHFKPKKGFYMK